ncbi:MAG: lipocalin-like domain-containing protein [Bacteroidaceae bacterium]|nr:lipocalin-like domain-containing protein [Bacteroidaceae bacterium]
MKRVLFTMIVTALMLCSCQKEDKNGDLGGFWKIMETVDAKGVCVDTKEESLFWRVQLKLMQIGKAYARFQHTGDSLFVQMIEHSGKGLQHLGIYRKEERFAVEHLDRNGMILISDSVKIRFRKF